MFSTEEAFKTSLNGSRPFFAFDPMRACLSYSTNSLEEFVYSHFAYAGRLFTYLGLY